MACPTGKLHVESKDPRINYNLLPGEKLLTCPYNHSHGILPLKFAKHVMNCHRLHVKEQTAKNQEPLFRICQYDRSHHVRKEELAYHEANCDKKCDWDDLDDWENIDNDSKPTVGTGESKVEAASPQKPDEATLKALDEEDWESESDYPNAPTFDSAKRIEELRKTGYRLVNTQAVVGLTRSEKHQFYKEDKERMASYRRMERVSTARDLPQDVLPTVSATTTKDLSCASSVTTTVEEAEDCLMPIHEED